MHGPVRRGGRMLVVVGDWSWGGRGLVPIVIKCNEGGLWWLLRWRRGAGRPGRLCCSWLAHPGCCEQAVTDTASEAEQGLVQL